MTACEACTAALGTKPDLVPDMINAQRLLLTVLNGDRDAVRLVAEEMNDCVDCRGRQLGLFLAMTAGLVTAVTGSLENAIKAVEDGLLADLDATGA